MSRIEQPVATEIIKVRDEAKDIKTFFFKGKMQAKPGQFILLWIPGMDEKPFGVSYQDEEMFAATVCKVGKFTEALFGKKAGDKVGVRGPYGSWFQIKGKEIALVAGGYGIAPLSFLSDEAIKAGIKVNFITGARTKELLVNCDKNSKLCELSYTTDDGSFGQKGYTTDALRTILQSGKVDCIYTVGPEKMMKKVMELSDEYNVDCQLSLERYMKCGFGVCGQCCVDDLGIRMCKEGPVLPKETVKKIKEFGVYHRDSTGKKNDY